MIFYLLVDSMMVPLSHGFLMGRISFLFLLPILSVAAAENHRYIHIEHKPGLSNLTNSSFVMRSDGLIVSTNSFGIADIRTLVAENRVSLTHAQTAVEQNRLGNYWFWLTVPVGFAARLATYPLVEFEVITPKTGWVIFGSGIAVSLIGALVSLHYFNNAKSSMYLGIREYNHPTTLGAGSGGGSIYFGGISFRL